MRFSLWLDDSSQRRRGAMGAIAVTVCLAVIALAVGAAQSAGKGSNPGPLEIGACPKGSTELPRSAISWATLAALKQADEAYRGAKDTADMYAPKAYVAPHGPRGGGAERSCGSRVGQRTVVVDLVFPEEEGASQQQGTVYLVRVRDDDGDPHYRIWDIAR